MVLSKLKRGQIWEVDFDPQPHKEEPGKRNRPALVIQTDVLNEAKHSTTIVIPGTTDIYRDEGGDGFPLRIAIGKLNTSLGARETDLLVDQIRTISNKRLMGDKPIADLSRTHMKRVEDALRILLGN